MKVIDNRITKREVDRAIMKVSEKHRPPPFLSDPSSANQRNGARFINRLTREINNECYEFQPVRWEEITPPCSKPRRLARSRFSDMVIHHLMAQKMNEADSHLGPFACAYRPGVSIGATVKAIQEALLTLPYWATLDVKGFFHAIPDRLVASALESSLADCLPGNIMNILHARRPGDPAVMQGMAVGPILANHAMIGLDRELSALAEFGRRYSDDLLFLARTREEAVGHPHLSAGVLDKGGGFISHKPAAGDYREEAEPLVFLGIEFRPGYISPSPKALAKLACKLSKGLMTAEGKAAWTRYYREAGVSDEILREKLGCAGVEPDTMFNIYQ